MPPSRLEPAIEALLFSSDQPLPLSLLCEALESPAEEVTAALQSLGHVYTERGAGVELREIAGGWMIVTTAEQAEWVGRMLRGKRRMRLSRAALETMAIIAYKQPVTKSEVEAIRGVDSSGVLATLLERNLVTIRGRSKVVGRPLLYGTTPEFLEYFGLRDLSELPRPEELRALVAAREPEQLDLMELEVVSQVASDLAAGEAAGQSEGARHEIEPLSSDEAIPELDEAPAVEASEPRTGRRPARRAEEGEPAARAADALIAGENEEALAMGESEAFTAADAETFSDQDPEPFGEADDRASDETETETDAGAPRHGRRARSPASS